MHHLFRGAYNFKLINIVWSIVTSKSGLVTNKGSTSCEVYKFPKRAGRLQVLSGSLVPGHCSPGPLFIPTPNYAAVQINSCSKNSFVIQVTTMKNRDDFVVKGRAITCHHQFDTFTISKDNLPLVSPLKMHCVYCCMPKGTSWAEATSNSKKSSP